MLHETGGKSHRIFKKLTVSFENETRERPQVLSGFSKFRAVCCFFEGVKHSGCQAVNKTNENVALVKELVLKNRRISILEFASMLGIASGSVQSILKHKPYMLWLATKYVPHTCHSVLSVNKIK
jgi:hypothetical protein